MSASIRTLSHNKSSNGQQVNNQKIIINGGTKRTPINNGRISPKQDGINFKTVQRIDKGAKDILKTVSCVVIYKYLEKSESWERTPMEGTLFIYLRDDGVAPGSTHAMMILSKLTNDNLLVHLHNSMIVHTNIPFVLFKKSEKDVIYGINFKKESTCIEVGNDLQKLCRMSKPLAELEKLTIHGRNNLTPSPTSSDGGDANEVSHDSHMTNSVQQRKDQGRKLRQGAYRRTSEPIVITHTKPRSKREASPLHSTKYSGKSNGIGHTHLSATPNKSDNSTPKERVNGNHAPQLTDANVLAKKLFHSVEEPPEATPTVTSDTPPVLNHLFASIASSPHVTTTPTTCMTPPKKMVSVSELEGHMTEGDVPVSGGGSPIPSVHRLLHPSAFTETETHSKPEVTVNPPTPGGYVPIIGSSFPSIPLLVQSPGMRSQPVATVTDHTPPTVTQSTSESTDDGSLTEAPPTSLSTLMSPQVFTGVNRSSSEPAKLKSNSETIGLSEQQLQQALLHLIKNDASFLTMIHKAYVDSLHSSTR